MNKTLKFAAVPALVLAATLPVRATNGDNLIGIGPISRAMGGTGIAAPQDAISAVFANPAAMCFTPGCNYAEVNFAGTLFMPKVSAELELQGMGRFEADSKDNVYAIPAIGISVPLGTDTRRWRFGLAAFGVSGLGVDYRGTALDQPEFFDFGPMGKFPLIQGEFSSLMIMKFAPAISYQVSPKVSVGASAHLNYATLDLRNGSSPAYGIGVQVGAIFRPTDDLALGVTYISPQSTEFDKVVDYMGTDRDLELESPQTIGVGLAYTLLDKRLLLAVDGKWLNWGAAAGYKDFDWEDQWVVAVGAQYAVIAEKLFARIGYNYGKNPLQQNNGWGQTQASGRMVQGMMFPDYYFETFRGIGFPAIVEHHLTAGLGYAFSEKFEINVAYKHAFQKEFEETGTFFGQMPARFKSTLSENAVDFGLTWRF